MTNFNNTNTTINNTTDANNNTNELERLMKYIDLDSINTDEELKENAGLLEAAVNTNDKRLLKTDIKSSDISIRIPMEILAENEEAVKSVLLKTSKSIASVVSHVSGDDYDETLETIENSLCKSVGYSMFKFNTPISKVDIADGEAVTIYIDSSISRMLNNITKHPKTCDVINRICKLVESFYDLVNVFKIEEAKWLKSILSRFHRTDAKKK